LGGRYYAIDTENGLGALLVDPIERRVTYYTVTAREVLEIWHRRRRRNGNTLAAEDSNG
jgi:hypothetical protein